MVDYTNSTLIVVFLPISDFLITNLFEVNEFVIVIIFSISYLLYYQLVIVFVLYKCVCLFIS